MESLPDNIRPAVQFHQVPLWINRVGVERMWHFWRLHVLSPKLVQVHGRAFGQQPLLGPPVSIALDQSEREGSGSPTCLPCREREKSSLVCAIDKEAYPLTVLAQPKAHAAKTKRKAISGYAAVKAALSSVFLIPVQQAFVSHAMHSSESCGLLS